MVRLVSWNVNGLRSAEKYFLEFVREEQPDVVLLQEVRAHPNDLSFFLKFVLGYKTKFNPSDRPGYSGTALYYKENLAIEVPTLVGERILDLEGRAMKAAKGGLTILNFYVPNGNSSEERFEFKLRFYGSVTSYVENLLGRNLSVVIGGDLNVAHRKIDLFSPETSNKSSGFLPVEREWFSSLLELGFVDTFRMFERGGGHYTWWHLKDPERKKNLGWRYDYFLVSEDLKGKVRGSKILRDVFGSDHCPIILELDV